MNSMKIYSRFLLLFLLVSCEMQSDRKESQLVVSFQDSLIGLWKGEIANYILFEQDSIYFFNSTNRIIEWRKKYSLSKSNNILTIENDSIKRSIVLINDSILRFYYYSEKKTDKVLKEDILLFDGQEYNRVKH